LGKFVFKDGLFNDTKTLFHLYFLATRPIVQFMFLFICDMLWSFTMSCGLSSDGGKCYVVHMWRQVYGSWGFIFDTTKVAIKYDQLCLRN
jgi:hypothetical protein